MRHDAEYVRVRLRALAVKLGSQRALAKAIGCSPALLNDTLLGHREPAEMVCSYLGLKRRVSYEPASRSARKHTA